MNAPAPAPAPAYTPAPAPAPPRRSATPAIAAFVLIAVLIGGWELYASHVDNLLLPEPHQVAQSLWNDRSLLLSNLRVTAEEVGLGILLSLALGVLAAIAVHTTPSMRALYPLGVASQAVPIAVIAPLLAFWLGFGIAPKLVVIAIICFFPVMVTTIDALAAVDAEQLKLLRTLGASRWQAFRFVEAPAALPAALSGARISVGVATIAAVFGEYTGSSEGVGHLIEVSLPQFEAARAWAATVLLGAFSMACFFALGYAERRLTPWTRPRQGATPL
jgi:putative hydroxymethylpyrimidine transport system permease protein